MHIEAPRSPHATPHPVGPPRGRAADRDRFARVHDMAFEPGPRTPPPEVLEAVEEAARVYAELDAAGLHVRFELVKRDILRSIHATTDVHAAEVLFTDVAVQ